MLIQGHEQTTGNIGNIGCHLPGQLLLMQLPQKRPCAGGQQDHNDRHGGQKTLHDRLGRYVNAAGGDKGDGHADE